jgi:hypothetical protein
VSLHVANDSRHLVFFSPENGKELCHRYLRNETSIQEEVARLKVWAAAYFEKRRFPADLLREHEQLWRLLHLVRGVPGEGDGR